MTRRARRALCVALVAAVVATGLGACSVVGGGGESYRVTAFFSSAISLYKDSQVRVMGLPAGRVQSIKVEGTQVRVVLSVPEDIPLPENVEATIIPLSFIGERYVQLSPAWREGQPRLAAGAVIPIERTTVPVEPDEALAALKHLLDSIDPSATGRLVTNLADGLEGTGDNLNDALAGLGTITETLGAKDAELGAIIDHFDRLTATLATRDATLGRVLDAFARTTDALADERASIQSLLASLASITTNGLALVGKHRVQLDKDITVLSRTLRLVGDNMDQLDKVLSAAPVMTAGRNLDGKSGLAAAYNKELHAIDLRTIVTPALSQAFVALGLPVVVCEPVTTTCQLPGGIALPPDLPDVNAANPASVPERPKLEPRKPKTKGGLSGVIRAISGVFG